MMRFFVEIEVDPANFPTTTIEKERRILDSLLHGLLNAHVYTVKGVKPSNTGPVEINPTDVHYLNWYCPLCGMDESGLLLYRIVDWAEPEPAPPPNLIVRISVGSEGRPLLVGTQGGVLGRPVKALFDLGRVLSRRLEIDVEVQAP